MGTIDAIIRDVAELPDRTSPEDWPDAMLVTADELRAILLARISDSSDTDELVCVNGHDRCYGSPDSNCPYCERRSSQPEMSTTGEHNG